MRDARTDREKEERSEERWEGGREGRREKGREGYQIVLPEIFLRLTILRTLFIQIFYLLGSKDYVFFCGQNCDISVKKMYALSLSNGNIFFGVYPGPLFL